MSVLKKVVEPTSEPLTIQQLKNHSRIRNSAEDLTTLPIFLTAAREWVEEALGQTIASATWEQYYDHFPREMVLPMGPVQSLTYVKYYDENVVQQTLNSSVYNTDLVSSPARIILKYGQVFPITAYGKPNSVLVRYVAGMTVVPQRVNLAILNLAADWFERREDSSDRVANTVPNGVMRIVRSLRRGNYV